MFAIGIHDSAAECLLKVSGRLEGAAVRELEQCWRTAASTAGQRRMRVDLYRVEALDPAGEVLIESMHREGVHVSHEAPVPSTEPAWGWPRTAARFSLLALLLAFPPQV